MQENQDDIFDDEIDEPDDLSGDRKIYTEQGDPEVESLHKRYKRGRLNIQPNFQRQFVWDKVKSSRLIESALLDIPIPIIYLSEDKDGKENVIDGQQRLTAFFSFIDDKLPDNSEFKLTGLNVFRELNGKKFNQLSEEHQDKIMTYKIRVIKFKKESDSDLQFEIFTRLNTGSVPLNDQELRNCVFRGRFNDLIKELSQDSNFKDLLGIERSDSRMKDRELVLRFAAFQFNTYLNYNAPIKKFLNNTMEKYQNISAADELKLRDTFKNTISIIKSLLDKNAFKRFYCGVEKNKSGKWETKQFNVSLFDILMYSFAREDKNTVLQNLDRIKEALIDLMTSDLDFINSIELSTSSKKAVTIRFDKWRLTLQTILGIGTKEPRCFTYALKKELFEENSTCAICGNRIINIDDAAVDHIEQYWTGGKTIPENARLTHRYCNNARSRIELFEDGSNNIAHLNSISTKPSNNIQFSAFSGPETTEYSENTVHKKTINNPIVKDERKYKFFEQFLSVCNQKTHIFSKISPQGYQNWIRAANGKMGFAWVIHISSETAKVVFYLNSTSPEKNRNRINYLFSRKEKIEERFGESFDWHTKDSLKQPCFRTFDSIGGMDNEDQWPTIQNDLVEKLIRFENAISPYITEISKTKETKTVEEHL
ncbi:MAG: DUF4268 domain-containing protein [Mariniphaga sp.]|nr:DUF4268 domain-containing protein [Mariniphaga sp.]